jgi:hypothetical protein
VTFIQYFLNLVHAYVRVLLGSTDTDVSQHLLNHPYICPMVKQMSRERVSKELSVYMETNLESHLHNHISHGCTTHRRLAD